MAKYRITKAYWAEEDCGKVIDWDGVTVDEDDEVELPDDFYGGYVHKDYLELVEPVSAGKVTKTTKTVEQEVYVLTLSKEEAVDLFVALEDDDSDSLEDLYNDLDEVLNG